MHGWRSVHSVHAHFLRALQYPPHTTLSASEADVCPTIYSLPSREQANLNTGKIILTLAEVASRDEL